MKLPDFLIADLYKDALIETGHTNTKNVLEKKSEKIKSNETLVVKENKTISVNFLGENDKKICVIVYSEKVVFIEDDDLLFLTNILKSVELNLADIALINLAVTTITYVELEKILNSKYFIFFGTLPSSISMPFIVPHFQIQKYADINVMTAPTLADLNKKTEESKLQKTKLWVSLKNMFCISK